MIESREYFAGVAVDWDEMRAGYFTETMRDAAIARARLAPDAVVADVGTGTGFVIQGLAPRVAKVYGFDESPEMLAVARRNLAAFRNVELREAKGNALPLPDNALDAVFGNMYLHHAPDPQLAIAELARVLRPGGRLVLTDMDSHDQEWMRDSMADRWLGFERDDVRAWYAAAGLAEIDVDCAAERCCAAAPDGHEVALSVFVAYGLKPPEKHGSGEDEQPDLIYTEYQDAGSFLAPTRAALERHESVNGLMLGLGLRLVHEPDAYGSQPYFATVGSAAGLQIAALMTPPHKLLLYAEEDRERPGVRLIADALLRGGWPVPGVLAREAAAEAFAATWHSQTGVDYQTGMRQRIYELRQVRHPRYPAGEFRPAALGDIELVRQWACGFYDDCFGGGHYEQIMRSAEEKVRNGTLYLWVDGVPTSMAARTRPTPHGEAVGYVYTPPSQRQKGYASALVARLSQRILDDGKAFCTLYTDLANSTSNRIYQQIGYTAIADVIDIDFAPSSQAALEGGSV